jgi:DNA helicase MCM8
MAKSVAENLNVSSPLLSRFDLVFILQDRVSLQHDSLVSSSIIDLYRSQQLGCSGNPPTSISIFDGQRQPENLRQRLRWVGRYQKENLPVSVLRDYVSYAKEYCKPKLTRKAANILHSYFMSLRHEEKRSDSVPITTRQLESLIRLSQARAKAALRDFVLEEDAQDVVELMMESVNVVHKGENYNVGCTMASSSGATKRKQKLAFISGARRYIEANKKLFLTLSDLRQIADIVRADVSSFLSLIEELREEGRRTRNILLICFFQILTKS